MIKPKGMENKYTQAEFDSPVYCMVNTMRSVPVMREPRAVLITFSTSEDLCQSLRAHFIQPENSTKSPLIYHFTSFSHQLSASQLVLLIHYKVPGSLITLVFASPLLPHLPHIVFQVRCHVSTFSFM